MKKTSKILLSALAISSMFFTMTVNAQELTSTPSEDQNITVAQETTKTVSSLTQEELNTIIPNEIEISTTKTDVANYLASEMTNDNDTNPAEEALIKKIIPILTEKGYTISEENFYDYFYISINLYEDVNFSQGAILAQNSEIGKDFTIKYAKESNYNTTDETYVKNAVNNIKFTKYEGTDAVFTMYNIGDEENASKWTTSTYDFSKLLNDSSITVNAYAFGGGMGSATLWGVPMRVNFYKNGVLYEVKEVWNLGAYGTTLDNGTPVNMAQLDKEYDKEIYAEMEKQLKDKGITDIIGAYELTAYGNTYNNMSISFNVGAKYNGKQVTVLHKKNNNTYETLTTTVKDGKAEITVSEFSPFMIALSDSSATTPTTENVNKAPNNAQTSSIDIVLYSILALGSLVGITYILVSKKKKEIA